MRALITGASGFVGSTLAERLLGEGHTVRLLMRKSSSQAHLGEDAGRYEIVFGDLREADSLAEAVRDVDCIYHVAGVVAAPRREDYFSANTQGTANLAEAAKKFAASSVKRFVYVSSLAAAGPAVAGVPREESQANTPISIYGESKLGGEEVLQSMKSELASVICRPPAVYGPRDSGMLTFFKMVNSGFRPSLKGLEKPGGYSFIYVDDLVSALVLLGDLSKEIKSGEVFFAAGDEELTWDESMEKMATALGKKGMKLPLPVPLLKVVGTVSGAFAKMRNQAAPLNSDKTKEIAQAYWTCSNAKLKGIGFEPKWRLADGFQATADWYRKQGWL